MKENGTPPRPPRAAILAIGSELLTPRRTDTNSLYLTARLNELGLEVDYKAVVGDNVAAIAEELKRLAASHDLVVVSGGLGPTDDDVTREAVARAFGRDLVLDPTILAGIEARFSLRGLTMPAINRRQAMVIGGSQPIFNPRGTAPGALIEIGGSGDVEHLVALLPGVPLELREMAEASLLPLLAQRFAGQAPITTRIWKCVGLGESACEERVTAVYARFPQAGFTILAGSGEVQLQARVGASGAVAEEIFSAIDADLVAALGHHLFGRDAETLEQVVGRLLAERAETLAVAESCTGGGFGERITRIDGSSRYFLGGVQAYANSVKTSILGVDAGLIQSHGAVSGEVAMAMASNVRQQFGATHGVGITGVAGPGGGSPEKPVGTVFVAVADETSTEVKRFLFYGDRAMVRDQSTLAALNFLRSRLSGRDRPRQA